VHGVILKKGKFLKKMDKVLKIVTTHYFQGIFGKCKMLIQLKHKIVLQKLNLERSLEFFLDVFQMKNLNVKILDMFNA